MLTPNNVNIDKVENNSDDTHLDDKHSNALICVNS